MVFLHPHENNVILIFLEKLMFLLSIKGIQKYLNTGNVKSRISHLDPFVNDLYFHWDSECLSLTLSFENSCSYLMVQSNKKYVQFLYHKSVYKTQSH